MTYSFLPVRTCGGRSWGRPDRHLAHDASLFRPDRVHVQKPVLQYRSFHLHAVGEDEAANETARGYAAMQVRPLSAVALGLPPAGDGEVIVLHRHAELVGGETGHGDGDPNPSFAGIFDVVG